MTRTRTLILLLMAVATLMVIALAVMLLSRSGGPLSGLFSISSRGDPMTLFVQSPPMANIGDPLQMVVTVQNNTDDYLSVDDLLLPNSLVRSVVVTSIVPGTINQQEGDTHTAFHVGILLAPRERFDIIVNLVPSGLADVMGEIQVTTEGQSANDPQVGRAGVRWIFAELSLLTPPTPAPVVTIILPSTPTEQPAFTPTPSVTPLPVIPYQAVVLITPKVNESGELVAVGSGSGVIISADGLVLTNAHVVTPPSKVIEVDAISVSLIRNPEDEPVETYFVDILQVDKSRDIAVLRIVQDARRNRINNAELNLPYVPLGDSDSLQLGDPLIILGYPLIGGSTITLTRGDVAGFTAEGKFGSRAWIKTNAVVSLGVSGGLVLDRYGFMVGIPTRIGYGRFDDVVDCRIIADTNGDGGLNSEDNCVPVGGFINSIRPINLAKPLIEGALRVLGIFTSTPTP